MPDMDTPQIPTPGSGVVGVQASKRPRDDGSPVCGKRGRGENGDVSLKLKIPIPSTAPLPSSPPFSSISPPWVPPLCESPSKINQAPSSFAPFSGGAAAAAKPPAAAADDVVTTSSAATAVSAASRRKGRVPHTAPPSLGATDPIFHAALLRVLHGRNGAHCPEAVGWRWRGDAPARFDHWPCALHPSVMDLLACVSASEEQVVMTGCDKKHARGCGNGTDDVLPPVAVWRAPRPRTSWTHREASAAAAGAATPTAASSPSPLSSSVQTPVSALRRTGSTRRPSSKNRVRFSTHDMSVVDTPDPQRGGSEEGMMSALGGLQSILSAGERVRELVAGRGCGSSGSGGRGRAGGGSRLGHQHYEGYFDRFSATGGDEQHGAAAVSESAAGADENGAAVSKACGSDGGSQVGGEGSTMAAAIAAATEKGSDGVDSSLETEANSVREDSAALVAVLDEIACSDVAPEEIALTGGWGPEHRNAAAFYAKELAFLCGTKAGNSAQIAPLAAAGGAVGSHLRARYLDVLSCLVRYNLKLLLNTCECEPSEEQGQDAMEQVDAPLHVEETDKDEVDHDECASDDENDASISTANLPPAPTAALTVMVPGRAALLRDQGLLDAAWGSSVMAHSGKGLCSCVAVLDDKGALEFNTEDVAALLTLALGRVYPFMPLAARITLAAEEAGWDGGCGGGDEALDERVWAAVQQYILECRAPSARAAAASPTHLFSSPSTAVAVAMSPPPPKTDGPPDDDAAHEPPSRTDSVVGGRKDDAKSKEGLASDEAKSSLAGLASPNRAGNDPVCPEVDGPAAAVSAEPAPAPPELELTADESADLLEFVAAARFIAQLLSEPVVAAGISQGRWSCATRLSKQVRKLAEEEQKAQEAIAAASGTAAAATTAPTSSLSSMVCLGALADVRALGLNMAQQARYAPALEAVLKRELRQALRRGQGLKRRIKHRLQPPGAPAVFSFPMITPACQLVHYVSGLGCV